MKRINSNKISKIVRCIIFILVFVFCFNYISYVLRPVSPEEIGFKSFYAEKKNTLDVIYIGGSVCIVDWVPYTAWAGQGITSYAYGKSTLYSFNVLPLVKEALQYQSPDLFVIDLRPFEYTGTERSVTKSNFLSLASSMPFFSPNRQQILRNGYTYASDLDENDTELSFYMDLIRYHGQWKSIGEPSFGYAIPGQHSNNTKGYLFINKHESIVLNDNSDISEKMPCPANAEDNLRELISYLTSINKKAVFVVAPYQETIEQRKQYNYLAEIIKDNGFDYINANDFYYQMGMDETRDFYNVDHTNIFGADKYTEFLSNYLITYYDLPDRRKDEEYANYWNEGYTTWIEQSNQVKSEIEQLIADSYLAQ